MPTNWQFLPRTFFKYFTYLHLASFMAPIAIFSLSDTMTHKQITRKEITVQDVSLVFPATVTFYAGFFNNLNGYLDIVLQRQES